LHFLISSGTTQEQGRQKVVKKGVKKSVYRCVALFIRPPCNLQFGLAETRAGYVVVVVYQPLLTHPPSFQDAVADIGQTKL